MRYLISALLAFGVGVIGYEFALRLVYGQTMGGDAAAVVFSMGVAFAIALPVVYLPILVATRRALNGFRPLWAFPLVAAMIGVAPTLLIVLRWGGDPRAFFSPEAALFLLAFAPAGAVLGLGYAVFRPRADAG